MTPLCELQSEIGWCRLPQGHRGHHRTGGGKTFTYEDALEWHKRAPEAEAEQPMNRAERRAAKKLPHNRSPVEATKEKM